MSNDDEDKLVEGILEFDRLMAAHEAEEEARQSTYDTQHFLDSDDVNLGLSVDGGAKPKVDSADDAEHGAIELVQLPVPNEKGKSKQLAAWQLIETETPAVVGRMTSVARRTYSLVKSDLGLIIILLIYSVLGAVVLHHAEYDRERLQLSELAERRRHCISDIVDAATSTDHQHRNLSATVERLVDQYVEHKERLRPSSKAPEWTYWGAIFFCGTVFTTVGYGYIYPVTTAGRVITMVYALIGIPLCMVVLAGLGKSLTRAIKYFWSFVRRFYYTGSFRRVRSVIPLSRVRLTFCQRMFNRLRRRLLTRRRQQTIRAAAVTTTPDAAAVESTVVAAVDAELECLRELDETFVPYEVDDKFDLPPIIALVIAFLYILLGAFIYTRWEDWTYFEAFYFTFISLCTIGFGDVVPDHPKNLMATGVYLVFGLALIAMVVNVVMEAVDSTIARAKDGVRDVGRRIVDVAQRQTVASLQQQVASTAQSQLQWVNATARSSARRHSI